MPLSAHAWSSSRGTLSARKGGMKRNSKCRLVWLCMLAVSYACFAMGQSLDASLPSAQIDSNISSMPQASNSGGEHVKAAIHPLAQGELPSVQVNSDVTENVEAIVQADRVPSAPSSTAIRGWRAARRQSNRGRYAEIRSVNRSISSRAPRTAGGVLGRGATQRTSDKLRAETKPQSIASDLSDSGGEFDIYQENFPDSTQRATFASPPDPGTESPLAWSPSLSVGLRDMQTTQFLNPSLRPKPRGQRRRSLLRRNGPLGEASALQSPVDKDLNPDPERQLQDDLDQPTFSASPSSIDQPLDPNVER